MGSLNVDELTPEVMAELRGYVAKYHARGESGVLLESTDLAAIMYALPALVDGLAQARAQITALQGYNNRQVEDRRAAEAKARELTETLAAQVDAYRELGARTKLYKQRAEIAKGERDMALKRLNTQRVWTPPNFQPVTSPPPPKVTPAQPSPACRCCRCQHRRA